MMSDYRGRPGGGMSYFSNPTLNMPTGSGRSCMSAGALRNILREGGKSCPAVELGFGGNATRAPGNAEFSTSVPILGARGPSALLKRLNVALRQASLERS